MLHTLSYKYSFSSRPVAAYVYYNQDRINARVNVRCISRSVQDSIVWELFDKILLAKGSPLDIGTWLQPAVEIDNSTLSGNNVPGGRRSSVAEVDAYHIVGDLDMESN